MVIRLRRICDKPQNLKECLLKQTHFPNLPIRWPAKVLSEVWKELSPDKNAPTLQSETSVKRGRTRSHTLIQEDGFVLLHALPYELQVRWAWLAEHPRAG